MAKEAKRCILEHFGAKLGLEWMAYDWSQNVGRIWRPCIHFGHKTKGLAHSLLNQPQGHAFPSNSKAHNHFKSHAKNHPFHQKQSINSHAKPPLTHMHPNKANLANPTCILYSLFIIAPQIIHPHALIFPFPFQHLTCISTFLLHHFTTFSLFNSTCIHFIITPPLIL